MVCFVTQVLSTFSDSVPRARKRHPNLPRCACADLRFAPSIPASLPLQGRGPPPLALATHVGVSLGQGVFVNNHGTAIQRRRNHPMYATAPNTSLVLLLIWLYRKDILPNIEKVA
jgi:hypothetical protein